MAYYIGSGLNDRARKVGVDSTNRVYLVGDFTQYDGDSHGRIVALNNDGTVYSGFSSGSGFDARLRNITFNSSNLIYVAGDISTYNGSSVETVVLLNRNGTKNSTWHSGFNPTYSPTYNLLLVDDNDDIYLTGQYNNPPITEGIRRFNSNGSLDSGFDPDSGFTTGGGNVEKFAYFINDDDRPVFGGDMERWNDNEDPEGLILLNTDGTLNTGFMPTFNNNVTALAQGPSDSVFAGGDFTSVNGTARNRIVKINDDGDIDTSFNVGTGVNNTLKCIIVLNNNKVLICGSFTSYNGTSVGRIARLNSNGSLDTSFNSGGAGFTGGDPEFMELDSNGNIHIGGNFDHYNGKPYGYYIVLDEDGNSITATEDSYPTGLTVTNTDVFSIDIQWTNQQDLFPLRFYYKETSSGTWIEAETGETGTTSFSFTGLSASTSYDFKVCFFTPNTEVCSSSITQTTLSTKYPTDFQSTNISFNQIEYSWTINEPLDQLVFQVHNGSAYENVAFLPTSATTYTYTGLTSGTTYQTRIGNFSGTSYYFSDDDYSTTLDVAPPTNLHVTGKTTTSIGYQWTNNTDNFVILYAYARQTGSTSWVLYDALSPTGVDSYVHDGLPINSCWDFKITGVLNTPSLELDSNIVSDCVLPTTIPLVQTDGVTGITYTSANGGGTVVDDGGDSVTERGICWSTSMNPTTGDSKATSGTGEGSFRAAMTGLVPNKTYYVRAYAVNDLGIAYGKNIFFTTKGLTSHTYLRFGDGRVSDLVIKDFETTYQLSDIKNIYEAKTSFTLPIKLPYTPDVVERFNTLFNVNNISDITDQKIDCQLIYKNTVLINGFLYVNNWDLDYIYVIVARNDIGIFEKTKEIYLDDLNFTGSTYEYNNISKYERMRQISGSTDPIPDSGYTDTRLVFMNWWDEKPEVQTGLDYWGLIGGAKDYNNLTYKWDETLVIKAKTIFDKIIEEQGFTYSGSSEFIELFDKLYMTTNVPVSNYTDNVQTRCYFEEDTGANPYKPLVYETYSGLTFAHTAYYSGTSIQDKGVSTAFNYPSTVEPNAGISVYAPLLRNGPNDVTLNIYAAADSTTGTTTFTLYKLYNTKDPSLDQFVPVLTYNIFVSGTSVQFFSETKTVKADDVTPPNLIYSWGVETEDCTVYSRTNQVGYTDAGYIITTPNYLYYTGTSYTFNDLLPKDMSQDSFLKYVIRKYGLFTYVSDDDKNHINFKTISDFYTDDVLDWSDKLTLDKIKMSDTSKQLYSSYVLKNKNGNDDINKAYVDVYDRNPFERTIYNDNEISQKSQSVNELLPENFVFTEGVPLRNGELAPIATSIHGSVNAKFHFGYINRFSAPEYAISDDSVIGINALFPEMEIDQRRSTQPSYLTNYDTLSPFFVTGVTTYPDLSFINDPSTFCDLYESKNLFLSNYTGVTVTNNNLYTRFRKSDVEKKIVSQQRYVKCYMNLNQSDVQIENFRKKIWISNSKIGDAYYRLSKIVFPSDDSKASFVEMYNEVFYENIYDPTIVANIYNYDFNSKTVNIVSDQAPQPTSGDSFVYFGINGQYPFLNVSGDTDYKTWDVTFEYDIFAKVINSINTFNSSLTRLYYSTQGDGGPWTLLDQVEALKNGTGTEEVTKTDTATFTVTNPNLFAFRMEWFFRDNDNEILDGGGTVTIDSVSANAGSASVVCPDYFYGSGYTHTPNIDCS